MRNLLMFYLSIYQEYGVSESLTVCVGGVQQRLNVESVWLDEGNVGVRRSSVGMGGGEWGLHCVNAGLSCGVDYIVNCRE